MLSLIKAIYDFKYVDDMSDYKERTFYLFIIIDSL